MSRETPMRQTLDLERTEYPCPWCREPRPVEYVYDVPDAGQNFRLVRLQVTLTCGTRIRPGMWYNADHHTPEGETP